MGLPSNPIQIGIFKKGGGGQGKGRKQQAGEAAVGDEGGWTERDGSSSGCGRGGVSDVRKG